MPKRLNETVLNPGHNQTLSEGADNTYSTTTSESGNELSVNVEISSLTYDVSYNIPPTSGAVIIYLRNSDSVDYNYVIEPLKFGMLPVWAKPQDSLAVKRGSGFGPKYLREVQLNQARHFNCRKETIAQPKSMWTALRNMRCVVPAQGYFEWKKEKNGKTPYFVFLRSSPLIFFAALYAHNHNYNDTEIVEEGAPYFSSFAILTGPATGKRSNDLTWLHSRKPIVLEPNSKAWFDWLNPDRKFDEDLIEVSLNTDDNPAYDYFDSYVVAKSIGNPGNKGPEVIREEKKSQKSIGLFFSLPKNARKEDDAKGDEIQTVKGKQNMTEDAKKGLKDIKREEDKKEERKESNPTVQSKPHKNSPKKGTIDFFATKSSASEESSRVKRESEVSQSIAKRVRHQHQGSEFAMRENEESSSDDE